MNGWSQDGTPTIVIVGAGFSGTLLAAHLLRQLPPSSIRIVLVEREATVGSGLAYSACGFPHLLNVPAGRMSAIVEDDTHLLRFIRQQNPDATPYTYLPRHLYGEYLRSVLNDAKADAPSSVRLEMIHGETTSIHAVGPKEPVIVNVGARQLLADLVVLATGYPTAGAKFHAADLTTRVAYVTNPFTEHVFQASDRTALLIGSGLTMADAAVAASECHPNLRMVAVSRHGLLPHRQGSVSAATHSPPLKALERALVGAPLRGLVRCIRQLCRDAQQKGGDWREVIAPVRELTPHLWQSLSFADRSRFLRHVRTYWDIHRHRMPPDTADRIAELQRTGQLVIRAGHVTQLCEDGDRIVALWRPRGRYDTHELWVDRVVECSGPDHRLERTTDPLWRQLLTDGLAVPDAHGLGVLTALHGALVDVHGRSSQRLFYLGPMLRATYWEATAVGELRVHALGLATMLADHASALNHAAMPRSRARV